MSKREHSTRIELRTFGEDGGRKYFGYACSCGARGGEHLNRQGAEFAARYHRNYERERRGQAPQPRRAVLEREPEPTPAPSLELAAEPPAEVEREPSPTTGQATLL